MTTVPTRTYPDLDRRDPSLPVEHIIQPTITIKCPYEYGRSNGWQARVTWRNTQDGTSHSVSRRFVCLGEATEWASSHLTMVAELG